jgi:hypothetical protein
MVNFVIDLPYGSTTGFVYQWYQNGSPISGATDSVYNTVLSGYYFLKVSGGASCYKNSATKPATVKTSPAASFTTSGPTSLCSGNNLILTAPTILGYTYSWIKDGGIIGTGNSRIVKVSGSYSVVAKANSCTDTTKPSTNVVFYPLPIATLSATAPTTFCNGDSCAVVASPTGSGFSYQWLSGTTVLDSNTSPTYQVKNVATIKVRIIDNNGCVSKTSSSSVKTKVNPNPIATISPSGTVQKPSTGNIKLSASPSSGVLWQWYKNGVIIVGATAKQYDASSLGSYTVAITKLGCTGFSAPTIVSATGNKSTTEITNNQQLLLSAYPNPFTNDVYLQINTSEKETSADVIVTDIIGKVVYRLPSIDIKPETTLRLNLSNLSAGVYFISYKDNLGRTGVLKLIKEQP